jgi:uncharacterized protein
MKFEWDKAKASENETKYGITFEDACQVFDDPKRVTLPDSLHSSKESRWFCFGLVKGHVATVRFTLRGDAMRIIGAGYWRDGKAYYEKTNQH